MYNIDEELRRRVKLERLYDYEIVHDLKWKGQKMTAYHMEGEIYLDAALENRLIPVYLHEVGHAIARLTGLDSTPDSHVHNQYFAVLVAVMYRRANLLHWLKIYDFCDTKLSQKSAPILSPEKLTRRFRYIMQRSAEFAKTELSIEDIGRKILEEDAWPDWHGAGPATATEEQRSPRWLDIVLSALGGSALTVIVITAATFF